MKQLQDTIDQAPVVHLSSKVFQFVIETMPKLDAFSRLVACLLLLRQLGGRLPRSGPWKAIAFVAVQSLFSIGREDLFPLRIKLLDELLESETSTALRSFLLQRRANSRLGWNGSDAKERAFAIEDLKEALPLCRKTGDVRLEVQIHGTWARAEALNATLGGSGAHERLMAAVKRMEDVLERARLVGMDGDVLEMLSELEGLLAEQGDPEASARSISYARQAVAAEAARPDEKASRALNLAQALLSRGTRTERPEAVRLAREVLDSLPPDAPERLAIRTLTTLGMALVEDRQPQEAIRHLEQALQLQASGDPSPARNLTRVQLAGAYLATEREDDARHALHRTLEDARSINDAAAISDATRLLSRLDRKEGAMAQAADRHRDAEAHVPETVQQIVLALERLVHEPEPSPHEIALWADRYAKGQLPRSRDLDALAERLVAENAGLLPDDVKVRLLEPRSPISGKPASRAMVLDACGRTDEAIAELRRGLTLSDLLERRNAAALLIALLPANAHDERLRCCDLLEDLLDGELDHPSIRLDLATGLRMCARGNPGFLQRAWDHAERAARDLPRDARTTLLATRARADLRHEQVGMNVTYSSLQQAEHARWFEQPLALPPVELAQRRADIAGLLLVPGPLAHPDAVELAGKLLDLAEGFAPDLRARMQWLRERAGATPPVTRHRPFPFDKAPRWTIDLARGERPSADEASDDRIELWVLVLVRVRPDRVGALLSWLVERESYVPGLLQDLVQRTPKEMLGDLVPVVEQAAVPGAPFTLFRLHVSLRRVLRDGPAYERAVDQMLAAATTPEERIEARWLKGVERMDFASHHRAPDAKQEVAVEAARDQLSAAVSEARALGLPPEKWFHVLVSAGNAFRAGNEPQIDRALEMYEEAERLGAPGEDEHAKLWKVTAGALLDRGAPGDAARALELAERSLEFRRDGYLRVESLLMASRAELAQPDRAEPARLRRALARLDEARRNDDGVHTKPLAFERMKLLARIARLSPGDRDVMQALEEIAHQVPELAEDVERAKHGTVGMVPEDSKAFIQELGTHPAYLAFQEAMQPFGSPSFTMAQRLSRQMGVALEDHPDLLLHLRDGDPAVNSPEGRRAHVEKLAGAKVETPEARPGVVVALARVLSRMAELGEASATEVRSAAEEAESLVRRIPEHGARHMLLLELTRVWGPTSHDIHPVRDFARAAVISREVLAECAPGGPVARLALMYLARDTRYRTDGEGPRANLLEAEALYQRCLDEHMAAGELDVAAVVRGNLEEVRRELRGGETTDAGRGFIAALREQLKQLPSDGSRSQLANELTNVGSHLPTAEGIALLAEAKDLFQAIDWSRLEPTARRISENWHTMCLAELAARRGDRSGALELWRRRLATFDPKATNEDWGYAAHNHADMLLRTGASVSEIMEGLELCEQALLVRPLETRRRQHWETNFSLGTAIVSILTAGTRQPKWSFPIPPVTLWQRGRRALLGAIAAARQLDGSDRLLKAALTLLELATMAPTLAELERAAEEGWAALDEARPLLLLDEHAGQEESQLAAELAVSLAVELAESGIIGVSSESALMTPGDEPAIPPGKPRFVLSGARAERVLRWMVRATGAAQRRLAGRTARPAQVPHSLWGEWLAAIKGEDVRKLQLVLEKIRQHAPSFLRGEPDLDGTWRWLESRSGSAAIAVLNAEGGTIAAILEHGGQPRVHIAALSLEPPPGDAVKDVAESQDHGHRNGTYDRLRDWARQHILAPLDSLLPKATSAILWIPVGPLRLLAPSDLWPTCPVTSAVRLDLETRPLLRRPRSTLVAVADPGPSHPQGSLPGSVEAGVRLAGLSARVGPVRACLGRGERSGEALQLSCPGLTSSSVTPDGLLRELGEIDVALLLCHGEVKGPEAARFLLLDGRGGLAPLDVEHIARDPRLLAGLTVVLLSCETGRVGEWLHRASGLSGALLAAGARSVVAPLWSVGLDPAIEVGEVVLGALAGEKDVSTALHGLRATGGDGFRASSIRAFVHWVG